MKRGKSLLVSLIFALSRPLSAEAAPLAFIVQGGTNAINNNCYLYTVGQKAWDLFPDWERHYFVADGSDAKGPPNAIACDSRGFTLLESNGAPALTRRIPSLPVDGPARFTAIEKKLKAEIPKTNPGDPVLLYFAGHGSYHEGPGAKFELWGAERIDVKRLRRLMSQVPKDRKVIIIPDQCKGGGMLEAIFDAKGRPRPNSCGFSATQFDEKAWTREFMMDAVHNRISMAGRNAADNPGAVSFGDIYRTLDDQNFSRSTPLSSSELFLQKHMAKKLKAQAFSPDCEECRRSAANASSNTGHILRLSLQLQELEAKMPRICAKAGISSSCSTALLAERFQAYYQQLQDLNTREMSVKEVLAQAKVAFVQYQMGARYSRYQELKSQIEAQNRVLGKVRKGPRRDQELAVYRQLVAEYQPLNIEAWERGQKATFGNKAFESFVGGAAASKGLSGNLDLQIKSMSRARTEHLENLPPLRKADLGLKKIEALRTLLDSGDDQAIQDYLGLVDCEATAIRRRNP